MMTTYLINRFYNTRTVDHYEVEAESEEAAIALIQTGQVDHIWTDEFEADFDNESFFVEGELVE